MSSPKIAVGIDFSPESDIATGEAFRLARHVGAELVLVHVSTPVEIPGIGPDAAGERALAALRDYLARTLANNRGRLAALRDRMKGTGLHVVQALIEGYADVGLCTAARETGSELLVVGTHGYTGLDWFLLGSVAQRVIRIADVDVLVARSRHERDTDGYGRILVATDFSPSSARALARARQLAARDAEIDVVHFYHHAPQAALYDAVMKEVGVDLSENMLAELSAAGQSFIGASKDSGPTVRYYAVAEAPLPGLIHWLERQRFDLVALGSHGRRGFRRFLLGSVAEAVARRAPCSALIARGGPQSEVKS